MPVICRGSPRAFRAWPLAWPSPSGPLGWQSLQGQRRAAGASRAAGCEAPLRLEGPARTMRGVPARSCDLSPGDRRTCRDDRPGQLAERGDPRCVTAGRVLRRGAGLRRGGQRLAPVRSRARGAGQAAPPPAARVPSLPAVLARHCPGSFIASPCMSRILRESRPGPVGLARRRCALEAVAKAVTARPSYS